MYKISIKKLIALNLLALCFCNASAEVLRHIEQTSRDHYYLQVKQLGEAGREVVSGIVGGEHINYYHLLAFKGEAFTIHFSESNPLSSNPSLPLDSSLQWSVSGEGVEVLKKHGITAATVNVDGSWITVEVSAYPETTEYKIEIIRHTLPAEKY